MPRWEQAQLLAALVSRDPRTLVAAVRAAVRAAAIIGDAALVAGLAPLRHHPDELVRDEAAAALERMLPALVGQAR